MRFNRQICWGLFLVAAYGLLLGVSAFADSDSAAKEKPALIIGTSMGAMYAQQLHGFERICVNPSFALSKKFDVLYVGKHKWLNRRKDGETEFHVTKQIILNFEEMEKQQFDGIEEEDE